MPLSVNHVWKHQIPWGTIHAIATTHGITIANVHKWKYYIKREKTDIKIYTHANYLSL